MDPKDYRRALGSFPTGVTIVTAFDSNRQPWGLTANSFTSVSLEPPVISVCIAKTGRAFSTLANTSSFAVNILAADQKDLALHFASNVENRFDGTLWHANTEGAPLLPGASAQLDCTVRARIDAEDHEILLGLVENYTHQPGAPLVYCRGTFFAAPQPEIPA
ncbi:flavin reductase family protein [Octadecabacter ascidiaceicola]|uniref:FMN reductase (NADH) NtaB n=1 Tax=Octadecabacter ascidiaceicola TaxID=1655543 RepID=A0A238KU30_9RHOB|nr:flavin reductase family protein [Octadecabacter ascidiaceicola]SMX45536.1 FMN reductase (NADH) NtaB [Octadecabacter ascidiaceicola]